MSGNLKGETYTSFNYVLAITINAALGALFIGYKLGEMNMALINMKYLYEWSSSEEQFFMGALTSGFLLGCVLGCLLSGLYFLDLFGRRLNLILADLINIVGCILMMFMGLKSFPQLIGRFFCGIAAGINCSVVPTYISEIAPSKIRGELSSYFGTFSLVGIFMSYLLGCGFPSEETLKTDVSSSYWRVVFFFPTIAALIRMFLLLSYFNFEPAPYLLRQKKEKEAREVIEKIYKQEFVEEVYQEYKGFVERSSGAQMTYKELFRSKYRGRIFIGCILFLIQTMTGTNAVIFYSAILFGGPGTSEFVLKMFFLLLAMILIAGSFIAGKIVDKNGRKMLLMWGALVMIIEHLAIFVMISCSDESNPSFMLELLIKFTVLAFFFTFGTTLSSICWVFGAEILNDKGMSLCGISAWLSNFFLGFLFPFAVACSFIKVQGTFLIFAVCLMFGYFYIKKYVKETIGKSAEEIDLLYQEEESLLGEENGRRKLSHVDVELQNIKNENGELSVFFK